jgi:DNA-binding CsgD family transcriptional regulator
MDLSNIDLQQVGEAGTALKTMFDAVRSAIGIAKDARAIKQTSLDDRQAFDRAIDQAEQAASLAQAQVAQLLGYQLCRCTFPPAVMLTVGTFNGRAAHIADFTSKRAASAIRVPRPSGRLDYVVWSVPITKERLPTEMAGVSTIMVIVDPVAQPASRQGLKTLFHLSAAEADIVEALSNGFEAGEIAAKRNVTVNTVRTLRTRAYGKLGIASQLDLYRLVAAIPSDA